MLQPDTAAEVRIAMIKTSILFLRKECEKHLSRNTVNIGGRDTIAEVNDNYFAKKMQHRNIVPRTADFGDVVLTVEDVLSKQLQIRKHQHCFLQLKDIF